MKKRRKMMFAKPLAALALLVAALLFYTIWSLAKDGDEKVAKNPKISEENAKTPSESKQKTADSAKEADEKDGSSKENANKETDNKQVTFDKNKPFDHLAKPSDITEEDKVNIAKLPEMLQNSISKYPETKNEILKFNDFKSDPKNYDLTGQYQKGELPKFIQWDKRWGFEKISESYIAHSGCGPVALSSIYIYFTGDTQMNPVKMSQWTVENGYFLDHDGTIWDVWTKGVEQLGLKGQMIPFSINDMKNAFENKNIVVLNVGPGDFTKGGHYIMVTGTDSNDNLIIHDVNSPINSQKTWTYDQILPQVKNAWLISK